MWSDQRNSTDQIEKPIATARSMTVSVAVAPIAMPPPAPEQKSKYKLIKKLGCAVLAPLDWPCAGSCHIKALIQHELAQGWHLRDSLSVLLAVGREPSVRCQENQAQGYASGREGRGCEGALLEDHAPAQLSRQNLVCVCADLGSMHLSHHCAVAKRRRRFFCKV